MFSYNLRQNKSATCHQIIKFLLLFFCCCFWLIFLSNIWVSKEGLEDITGGALHFRNPDIREKDNPKAATEKEQKFFDDQMASGRYILSKIIGQHHFYVDDHSNLAAGLDTKAEAFRAIPTQMPEERQQRLQPIPASELPTPENIERAEQSADTMISYFEPEEEEDVKPFDPVENRRRQRRLAATR